MGRRPLRFRPGHLLVILLLASMGATACSTGAGESGPRSGSAGPGASGSSGGSGAGTSATSATLSLPPPQEAQLRAIFDPLVAPLGLRFTRGAVVARTGQSTTHLALYVEPIEQWGNDRFATTIVPLARLLSPLVFERWSGLESYDVCQEPSPGVNDSPTPPPVTQLDMERSYAESADWTALTLGRLAQDAQSRTDVRLFTAAELAPAVRAAIIAG